MFKRFQSDGPSDRNLRDSKLLDQNLSNPFPGRPATATPDNPPIRLFGRKRDLEKLISYALFKNSNHLQFSNSTALAKLYSKN